MKIIRRYNLNMMRMVSVLATLATLLALCACADGSRRLPEDVKKVVEATRSRHASDFAARCSYPLERPYPLRDLPDSAAMAEYYDVLVDDSLRDVITRSPHRDWDNFGWRGWTLRGGEYLWIDGKIYSIPYVSRAERDMMRQLAAEEMRTLPKHMRHGWHPAMCLKNRKDGTVYRIDASDSQAAPADSLFRLSVYAPDSSLSADPSAVLMGYMKAEGSAGVRTFYFRDRKGDSLEYSPDDTAGDAEEENLIWKPAEGTPVSSRVEKAYWRDLLK